MTSRSVDLPHMVVRGKQFSPIKKIAAAKVGQLINMSILFYLFYPLMIILLTTRTMALYRWVVRSKQEDKGDEEEGKGASPSLSFWSSLLCSLTAKGQDAYWSP